MDSPSSPPSITNSARKRKNDCSCSDLETASKRVENTREDNEVTDEDEELEEIDLAPKPDKEALDFFAGYAARKVSEKRIDGIFVINIDPRVDQMFLE